MIRRSRAAATALLKAIVLGDGGPDHQQVVDALLDAGADPTIADPDGVTPLEHAEQRGYTEMAALLRAKLSGWHFGAT